MKKKILLSILSLCAVFSLAIFGAHLPTKTIAKASTTADVTYTITDSGDVLSVTESSGNIPSSEFSTLSSAFYAIETYETAEDAIVKVILDNVNLSSEEQVILSKNLVVSGSLSTTNTSNIFLIDNDSTSESLSIIFEDLDLTNSNNITSDFSFIEVSGNGNSQITLNNVDFNLAETSLETSYAIYYNSTGNTLTLKGEITHDTTFFLNHVSGNNLTIHKDADNPIDNFFAKDDGTPIESEEKLYISIPYTTRSEAVCSNLTRENVSRFVMVGESDFFELSTIHSNTSLVVSSILSFEFETNGAIYENGYTAPSTFFFKSGNTIYTFPTKDNLIKDNYTFDGWFGSIDYDGTTYYFDQTALANFTANNASISEIATYFETDLSKFSQDTAFTEYCYTSNATEESNAKYMPVYFMAEHEQSPKFVAKWNINSFELSFDANNETTIQTETYDYGSNIDEPTTPTKIGHTFTGWYTELEGGTQIDFNVFTMPAKNTTLYAHWSLNTYTISFITNNEQTLSPITYSYGETILPFETLTKTGYTFVGWFLDAGDGSASNNEFVSETMPAENLTLHAVWTIKKFKVYFDSTGGEMFAEQEIKYGEYITIPENPHRAGYTFDGWYHSQDYIIENKVVWVDGTKYQIFERTRFYAKWIPSSYTLEIHTNNGDLPTSKRVQYNSKIELPTNLKFANHLFVGWFSDESLTTTFKLTTMPANNLSVYAKWKAKQTPVIDESQQIYDSDVINPTFENNSEIDNFLIHYYVDGEWSLIAPTKVGSYDIMITRNEDETYARYSKVLEDAFVIEAVAENFTWLIAILFVVAALEFMVAIAVRILRKMKFNMAISLAIPLGSTFIPSNQVILLGISGLLALVGLVIMIYQLVKLHRTVPAALLNADENDNTRDDIIKHSNKAIEEVGTYSASDIEDLLVSDTVGKAIKDKHKLNEKEFEAHKEKIPIGPIEYQDDDEHDDGDLKAVVEIVEDEIVFEGESENERIFNSDDPFIRKDPNDYSISDDIDE